MTKLMAGSHTVSFILSREEVLPYLVTIGLLPSEGIGDEGIQVIDASGRNRNFHIISARWPAYALKQGAASEQPGSLANEAATYGHLWHSDPAAAENYLPRLASYDAGSDILVTQSPSRSEDLRLYHQRLGRFPKRLGCQVGRVLAWVHRQPIEAPSDRGLADDPPWALRCHTPTLATYCELSAANIQLVRILQSAPDLTEALDRLHSEWRSDALIHNDVKWENILVATARTRAGGQVRLIDWELATRGDPRWDVGGAFAAYLRTWLFSIPITRDRPIEELAAFARFPMPKTWPAIRSLWTSYRDQVRLTPSESRSFLHGSVQFAAVRLIQSAYEASQFSLELSGQAVLLVQVADNMLRRSEDAAAYLLGLS